MRYLKQSTAITIVVGQFVDFSDGKTLLTDNNDFTPADLVCELVKGNSSSELTLTKTGGDNDINLTGKGLATLELTAANVGTLGQLRLSFTNAISGGYSTETILPFIEDFEVLPANVYDSMFSTDKLQVDVSKINGDNYVYETTANGGAIEGSDNITVNSSTGFAIGKIIGLRHSGSEAMHLAVIYDNMIHRWYFYPALPFAVENNAVVKCYSQVHPTSVRAGDLSTQAKAEVNAECDTALSDTGVPTAAKLLINKVIQNKTTGVITVYDDDGVTAILTLTPSDDGSQITLTPSTP